MLTASLHIDNVGGYPGYARTYKLSEAKSFAGISTEYVTIWIQKGFAYQDPEVGLIASTETGASAGTSVRRAPGSFVLHYMPETPEQIEGAFAYALMSLGVTQLV